MPKNYSNTAAQVSLTASVTAVATTLPVSATTGFPAPNFTLVLAQGTVNEELVLVTAVAGTNLTVTRGYDNTTAVAHDSGTTVIHAHSAEDFALSRAHENATSNVHGVTGGLVGTTSTQALSNKDLTSGTNTFPSTLATDAEVTSAVSTHNATTVAHGATGAVVGTTNTQTLTNKTLTSPTVTSPTTTNMTLDGVNISNNWSTYAPGITGATVSGLTARWKQVGKTVFVRVQFTLTGITGEVGVGLPVAANTATIGVTPQTSPVGTAVGLRQNVAFRTGTVFLNNSSIVSIISDGSGGTGWAPGAPTNWASGDVWGLSFTFEAA